MTAPLNSFTFWRILPVYAIELESALPGQNKRGRILLSMALVKQIAASQTSGIMQLYKAGMLLEHRSSSL